MEHVTKIKTLQITCMCVTSRFCGERWYLKTKGPQITTPPWTPNQYRQDLSTPKLHHLQVVKWYQHSQSPKLPSSPPNPVGVLMSGIIMPAYILSLPGVPDSQGLPLNSSPLVKLSSLKLSTLCGGAAVP